MSEAKKDSTQDVEIAVLTKQVEHMGDNLNSLKESMKEEMQSLKSIITSFIEITNKKVDRDVYLEDKRQMNLMFSELRETVRLNEDFRKESSISERTKSQTELKIWGVSRGTMSFIIGILTIVTLISAVSAIFK